MNIDKMTDAEVLKLGQRIQAVMGKQSVSSALAPELAEAKAKGITDGTSPGAFCTRAQAAVMTLRAIKKKKRPGIIPRPLFLAKSVEYWYNTFAAPPHTGNRKGVSVMVYFLISFLVSVAASVVAYYICKWLDRHRKGQ